MKYNTRSLHKSVQEFVLLQLILILNFKAIDNCAYTTATKHVVAKYILIASKKSKTNKNRTGTKKGSREARIVCRMRNISNC